MHHTWITFSDFFKFLSRSSHFSTRHDTEHATLTKNNTAKNSRNDLNGNDMNAHFLVQLFFCAISGSMLSTTVIDH